MTITATILKNTLDLGTILENGYYSRVWTPCPRLTKVQSKAESPINRSAKAVISRNLTTSRHNHLFIYVVFLFLFFIFYFCFYFLFLFFSYIYRKQVLQPYLHSDSKRCYRLNE